MVTPVQWTTAVVCSRVGTRTTAFLSSLLISGTEKLRSSMFTLYPVIVPFTSNGTLVSLLKDAKYT